MGGYLVLILHLTKYMKRISEKNDCMASTEKLYMLKLVLKVKINKSLKLLLVDVKANSSILVRLEMAGMAQKKQKYLISLWSFELE